MPYSGTSAAAASGASSEPAAPADATAGGLDRDGDLRDAVIAFQPGGWVDDEHLQTAAELLADWRAAGRDTAAAKAASQVASLALEAAKAADEAASETEAAASAAASAVDQALKAAASAKRAAEHAANAARILLASAEGDKARANHDLEMAKEAEDKTREEFHDSELQGFPRDTES